MGSHYRSIHVRSEDTAQLEAILLSIWTRIRSRFLMRPAKGGWACVYPAGWEEYEEVARAISEAVAGDVLQLMVHDSDVFAVSLYRDGELVDEGEWGVEALNPEAASTLGLPDGIRAIIPPEGAEALDSTLRQAEPDAEVLLTTFARTLGLEGARTSYGYLSRGESVDGWSKKNLTKNPNRTIQKRLEKGATGARRGASKPASR